MDTPEQNLPLGETAENAITPKPAERKKLAGGYVEHLKKKKHHLRGVQTVFKSTSANNHRLSIMADNKAFIMITVNSIIITVAIGLLISKFSQDFRLVIPTVILLGVGMITVVYSVLATRPNIPNGTFTRDDVDQKKVNLLFFGSYYKMDLKEFEYGMTEMMNDSEFLYGNLVKDIYWQGRNLGRKFRLLHRAYNIFMYGMGVAVLAYLVAAFF